MNNLYKPLSVFLTLIIIYLLFMLNYYSSMVDAFDTTTDSTYIKETQETIYSQKQKILDLEQAVRLGKVENTQLIKHLKQQSKLKAKTIVVQKKVPIIKRQVVIVDTNTLDTSYYIKAPINISYRDTWNYICGHVDTSYFHLDTLEVNNKFTLSIGNAKTKWWQRSKPLVELKSSNPYTKVELDNVTIKQKKKFWETPWFGGIIGAITIFLIK